MQKVIVESIDDLTTYRASEIEQFLSPIVPSGFLDLRSRVIWIDVKNQSQTIIFSVTSRGSESLDYEERKFSLRGNSFTATYYEVWVPDPNLRQTYYLDRAYFHLYKVEMLLDEIDEEAYMYMHCDPNETDVTHKKYKTTPHLHILQHDNNLTHAHLAIHLHKQEELLTDRKSITDAIKSGLDMLYDQIISD